MASTVLVGSARSAAADNSIERCIAANDKGLELRHQGKPIEARAQFVSCAAHSCGDEISRVCASRVSDTQAAIPTLLFEPKDPEGNDLVGATVRIDGAAATVPIDGRPIPVDPGPHRFAFEAHGLPGVTRSFIVAEGVKNRLERVDFVLPSTASGPGTRSGRAQRTAGYAVGAVGIAGVATGAVFGLLAKGKGSDQNNDCNTNTCTSSQLAAANSAHSAALTDAAIADIGFGVGAAAIVTGLVLILTAPHDGREAAAVQVTPVLGPSLAGLSLRAVVPW